MIDENVGNVRRSRPTVVMKHGFAMDAGNYLLRYRFLDVVPTVQQNIRLHPAALSFQHTARGPLLERLEVV